MYASTHSIANKCRSRKNIAQKQVSKWVRALKVRKSRKSLAIEILHQPMNFYLYSMLSAIIVLNEKQLCFW